jgi:hypothetical protein
VTLVSVEVVGAVATLVNPASLAADTGTSTLVDGFCVAVVPVAAGTATMSPKKATTVRARLVVATRFKVSFLTNTRLSERERRRDLQIALGLATR